MSRTDLPAWKDLRAHAADLDVRHLRQLFADDARRFDRLSVTELDFLYDFTRQRMTADTLERLLRLARECRLEERIAALFTGEAVNNTERRAAMHMALRNRSQRPMMVGGDVVEVGDDELASPLALVRSGHVMGNGTHEGIRDVVYVRPQTFEARHTPAIAAEIGQLNRALVAEGRTYVLIGFGRWGSADPWLGIPVVWAQIAGARVIVEAAAPGLNADMSQGAHFFHNLLGFRVAYFAVTAPGAASAPSAVDWGWLDGLPARRETPFVRHVETPAPLRVRVDGRTGRGVVLREEDAVS